YPLEPCHQPALPKLGRTRTPKESRPCRMYAPSPWHPQRNHSDEDTMAMRVNHGVEPIKSPTGVARGGSRPKPPKAVARRVSLEAPRAAQDHKKPKQRLTDKTVAFSRARHPNDIAETEPVVRSCRACHPCACRGFAPRDPAPGPGPEPGGWAQRPSGSRL